MTEILSLENFDKVLKENNNVVVDFSAVWCGPCQKMKPLYHKFEKETRFNNIKFCVVDIDKCEEIADKYKITSLPTFLFFKSEELYATVIGSNIHKVEDHLISLSKI